MREAPYSISTSFNDSQLIKKGVQIRDLHSMSFHPRHFIGDCSGIVGKTNVEDSVLGVNKGPNMRVFNDGGKTYVTLSGLEDVVGAFKKKQV